MHNLARFLAAMGHDVHAFTQAGARRETDAGSYALSEGTSMAALVSALRRGAFDVVHAHGARTPIAGSAVVAGRALGLRTVFTPHCFYPVQDWRGAIKRALFDPTLGAWSLRRSDRVICLTEKDRRDALQAGARPETVRLIPNSICLPRIPADEEAGALRRREGLGNFLLCVGRLDRVKGGDFLISALPQLPAALRLVFIGPDAGCLRAWQEQAHNLRLAERVRFRQAVSDDDLLLYYRASAAVVMASACEGLPTVLLEAMALGVPVIAAATGGIPHLIQHGINGFLYPHGDMDAFCANVQLCLNGAPTSLLARARECVRREYSWEVNAGRVAALYDEHDA